VADSPAAPAPPDTDRDVRLDDLPVAEAQTEIEPPYRISLHNNNKTNHL
jgi:hypothetical protein